MLVFVFNKSVFYEFVFKFKVFFMLKSIINGLKRSNVTHVKCLIVILFKKSHFDFNIKSSITHSIYYLNDFELILH